MYLIRLDDACEYMDIEKWDRMEALLDKYHVSPIVAIIPHCQDPMLRGIYPCDYSFWDRAKKWQEKGWSIGLHGFNHVYEDIVQKGVNPVNSFSEFVGVDYDRQAEKIRTGIAIFASYGLEAKCFVAPAHTFDENTIKALFDVSAIRIISDTIASDVFYQNGVWFVPQQCGALRRIPCKVITGCYHPNTMNESDYAKLESFLSKHKVSSMQDLSFEHKRRLGLYDKFLRILYFLKH